MRRTATAGRPNGWTPPGTTAPPAEEPAAGPATRPAALGSAAAGAASIRAYCLSRSEVRAADLQRVYRLSFSEACRALEELEALRLLGSMPGPGARRWGVGLPVDPARAEMLRKALGWGRVR